MSTPFSITLNKWNFDYSPGLSPRMTVTVTTPPGTKWTTHDSSPWFNLEGLPFNGKDGVNGVGQQTFHIVADTKALDTMAVGSYTQTIQVVGPKTLKIDVTVKVLASTTTPPVEPPPTNPPPTGTTEPSIMDWDTYPGVATPKRIGVVGWNVDIGALTKAEFSIDFGAWAAVPWVLNPDSNVVEYSVSVPANASKLDFRGTDAKGIVTNLPTLTVNDPSLYTLTSGKALSKPVADTGKFMVYDGCTLTGGGIDDGTIFYTYDPNANGSIARLRTYILNCKISNFRNAVTNMRLVRNCTNDRIGSQGFSDSRTVINSTVSNIIGAVTPQNHPDAYMAYSVNRDIILYGFVATQNLTARGIAIAEAGYRNVAIVGGSVSVNPGGASWEFGSKGGDLVENVLIKDLKINGACTWYPNPYKNVVVQGGSGMSNVPSGVAQR